MSASRDPRAEARGTLRAALLALAMGVAYVFWARTRRPRPFDLW